MTIALMIGGDGARWLSKSGYKKVCQSRGPGFESHRRGFEYWASSLPHSRDASSLSEKDGSRSHTKGGRRHSNVNAFPRSLLVSFL